MHKNMYKKMSSYLKEGMYVLLVTTFQEETGTMSDGLKKAIHVNSNKCEYKSPVNIHIDDALISTYEPMVADFVQDDQIKTGLDINVIYSIENETDEIVIATLVECLENSAVQKGMKMYIRKDGSTVGHIGDSFISSQVAAMAKAMFGTGEYKYVSIEESDLGWTYKVLLEDIDK